jgi:peroxygenase
MFFLHNITFELGFRRLGFNLGYSTFSAAVIHIGFAYPSQNSWIPFLGNPLFNIYTDKIHKCKHGSDSDTYDTEGRYIPEKFEEIFSKYDIDNKGELNFKDIIRLLRGNADLMDPFGAFSAIVEWGTLYMLCAKDGVIKKEDARTCFDVKI